ncbi:MAG: DUF6691 family protein [Ferruginibacter sp.]
MKDTPTDNRTLDTICTNESKRTHPWYHQLKYLVAGLLFGMLFVKAEIISWYRIQEMFRLQSFHMFGIIGSAVAVGMVSVWLIRRFNIKTLYGEPSTITPKSFNKGTIYGSLIFGFGWAITGSCPGPIFALIGSGATVMIVLFLSALLGTLTYGILREKLPH